MKPSRKIIAALIQQINRDAEANRLFWVAGLAREAWPVLLPHVERLHEVAAMAVRHYAEERQQKASD